MTTIICPHCGKDVNEEATFCAACGGTLELPVAAAEEVAEIPVQKGAPTWWRVMRCLFSIPLTALLIAALLVFTTLAALRNVPQKNTVKSLFKEIAPTKMLADVLTQGETTSLAAAVYDQYIQAATERGIDTPLSQEQLQAALDSSTLDEFLSEKTADYLSAILSGEIQASVTKDECIRLVRENESVIQEILGGYRLTAEDYTALENAIDESDLAEQTDLSKIIPPDDAVIIRTVQLAYNEAFYAAIALCLVLVLLLALFNLRGRFLTSLYSGIALLVAGSVASLTLALETLVTDIVLPIGLPLSANLLSTVVHTVISGFWKVGFCMLGGGILCIALFVILRVVRHRRKVV